MLDNGRYLIKIISLKSIIHIGNGISLPVGETYNAQLAGNRIVIIRQVIYHLAVVGHSPPLRGVE